MHSAGGHVPIETHLRLLQNRPAVRAVAEPDDGEQHRLFERAQDIRHVAYIVGIEAQLSTDVRKPNGFRFTSRPDSPDAP